MAWSRHLMVLPGLLAALLLPSGEGASRRPASSSLLRGDLRSEGPKQRLAMCIAGNLRTFNVTAQRIRPFLRNTSGVGLTSDDPDIFLYGTLAGADAKKQFHYSFAPLDITREEATRLVRLLQPIGYRLLDDAEQVTSANLDKHVANRRCFSSGFWHSEQNLIRSMNQLVHLQSCVDLILEHEERQGRRYDEVIISRPDMLYDPELAVVPKLLKRASQGIFVFQWDWFMLMPRPMISRLMDPSFARPLNCTKGQACCGRVKSSEDMFEFFFGASTRRDNGTCGCSDIKVEADKVTVGRLERTKRLSRKAARAKALHASSDWV